jgi:hypothetical protein
MPEAFTGLRGGPPPLARLIPRSTQERATRPTPRTPKGVREIVRATLPLERRYSRYGPLDHTHLQGRLPPVVKCFARAR